MMQLKGRRRIFVGVITSVLITTLAACGSSTSSSTASSSTATTSASAASVLAVPSPKSGCPSAACSAVVAAVESGTHLQALPAGLTPSLADASSDLHAPQGGTCGTLPIPGVDPAYEPCVYGSSTAPSRIVLLGDSHAWQWATAVASIAQSTNASFGLLYHASCFVTLTAPSLPQNGTLGQAPTGETCNQWTKAAIKWINNFNPQMVIVVGYEPPLPATQKTYSTGLVELFQQLQAPGRQLALIGQNPGVGVTGMSQSTANCLAAHESDVQACTTPESAAVSPLVMATEQAAASQAHARFVNMIPWACTQTQCPAVIGNFVVYQDPYHMTSTYAHSLSTVLGIALGLLPASTGAG
jgi:hypothetical protein